MSKKRLLSVIRNLALSALLLAGVSACRPSMLYWTTPEGPAEYQLGWQDGCDTGISAEGGYLKQAIYGFKKRPEMGENDQYKQGWNEGFTYCRFVEATQNKSD